ncbi:hypothetical protein [Nonomuraea sp. 10N515B]|uniref:hypothetical protein n=1 Tax=Nonomuraea sp. 10N515B TaxID=3457422 RepID=UPI003FCDB22E
MSGWVRNAMTSDSPRHDPGEDKAVNADALTELHALLEALERIIDVATASGEIHRRHEGMTTAAKLRELRHHFVPAERQGQAALTAAWYNRLALTIGDPANLSRTSLEARLDELEQRIATLAQRRRPWWRIW